jgi:hypothetical protein
MDTQSYRLGTPVGLVLVAVTISLVRRKTHVLIIGRLTHEQ